MGTSCGGAAMGAVAGDRRNPGRWPAAPLPLVTRVGMSTAAEIVHRAIRASGLGEPWCSGAQEEPDAVRVGNQLMLVETDCATGEAMLTKYVIAGGAATAVEVIAHDYGNAVRRLTSWLREAGQPMVWTRENPGLYRSGKYLVGQLDTGEWFAEGPGVDQVYDFKAAAQEACDAARE